MIYFKRINYQNFHRNKKSKMCRINWTFKKICHTLNSSIFLSLINFQQHRLNNNRLINGNQQKLFQIWFVLILLL